MSSDGMIAHSLQAVVMSLLPCFVAQQIELFTSQSNHRDNDEDERMGRRQQKHHHDVCNTTNKQTNKTSKFTVS